MKLNISISNDNLVQTKQGFYTLNELLDYLGLSAWEVQGQPQIEYGKETRIEAVNGSNAREVIVKRDNHGTYTAMIDKREMSYYVVSKFRVVLQVYKSTDSISAKTLSAIRYKEGKYDDYDNERSHSPYMIYAMYHNKYKKGQTLDNPFEVISWNDCKNATSTRRKDDY
jgi:hypothetical protein